ncbi:MAG: acetyl-CoA C-acetyltransferase [Candidatus Bathyarchaeia archaeon]
MDEIVIVDCVRTAIGNFGGALREIPVTHLGSSVVNELLRRNNLRPVPPKENTAATPRTLTQELTPLEKKYYKWSEEAKEIVIDEVIMGNVLQAGQGQNVARQVAIYGGLPKETPAYTVNKVCASGLKAISLAAQAIMTHEANVIIAGGMENMSNTPYALPRARWGYKMDITGQGEIYDLMVLDGLMESLYGYHMGITAENVAEKYHITRQEQDELGFLSHQRAREAIRKGVFKDEIKPILIPQKKGDPKVFDIDERPMETSLEKMAKLQPVFKKDGTVTAGNASGINDAAAAILLMKEETATQLGLKPLARITSFATTALDPAYMGLGPVPATKKALEKANLTLNDIDLIELNEAFAATTIACMRELELNIEKTNIYGSGISLGHPIGCTGARIVVTLLHAMKRNKARYGLATLCIGGGQGMAMVFELVN